MPTRISKSKKTHYLGKDVEQLKLAYTAGATAKLYSHFGK